MKTRRIHLHWQSFLAGILLCGVLAVFLGSAVGDPQNAGIPQKVLQRNANLNDVWEKTYTTEERIVRLEQKTDALIEKTNVLLEEVHQILKIVRGLDKELQRR